MVGLALELSISIEGRTDIGVLDVSCGGLALGRRKENISWKGSCGGWPGPRTKHFDWKAQRKFKFEGVFQGCLPGVGRDFATMDFVWEALENRVWEVSSRGGPRLCNHGFCLGGIMKITFWMPPPGCKRPHGSHGFCLGGTKKMTLGRDLGLGLHKLFFGRRFMQNMNFSFRDGGPKPAPDPNPVLGPQS